MNGRAVQCSWRFVQFGARKKPRIPMIHGLAGSFEGSLDCSIQIEQIEQSQVGNECRRLAVSSSPVRRFLVTGFVELTLSKCVPGDVK